MHSSDDMGEERNNNQMNNNHGEMDEGSRTDNENTEQQPLLLLQQTDQNHQPMPPAALRTRIIKRLGSVGRKHSNSDLQSRLKVRKLLGVGNVFSDNTSDVYKSKISQILGINERLYVRLPKGLIAWHTFNAVYFYGFGLLCLVLPQYGLKIESPNAGIDSDLTVLRLYGAALIGFALLFRGLLESRDSRDEISSVLLCCAILFGLQLIATLVGGTLHCFTLLIRAFGLVGNLVYHVLVDGQGGFFRHIQRFLLDSAQGSSFSSHAATNEAEKSPQEKDKGA